MKTIEVVYLVYIENPLSGSLVLKKVCDSYSLAKKWEKKLEEKYGTFAQIEVMPVEQEEKR